MRGVAPYRELARGAIEGERSGSLKLLVNADTRRVEGVHVFRTAAGEIVHIGQAVMAAGLPVDHLAGAVLGVPAFADASDSPRSTPPAASTRRRARRPPRHDRRTPPAGSTRRRARRPPRHDRRTPLPPGARGALGVTAFELPPAATAACAHTGVTSHFVPRPRG